MAAKIPTFELNTGATIPSIALGTWNSKKGDVGKAVRSAVEDAGYRHIDLASNYLNEAEVGDSLEDLFSRGVVKREELFVTGKLNNPYHHREHVRPHLQKTLKDLKLEYLDLWLMHWPIAFVYVPFDAEKRGFDDSYDPDGCSQTDVVKNGGSKIDSSVSVRETWEAMEELQREGLVKAIGVCNFTPLALHDLLTYAKVKPAVNQCELHPYLQQQDMVTYCLKNGIRVEAYSPLGTGGFKQKDEPTVLEDEVLNKLAKKYNKNPAQITLRWANQRGTIPLPKSVTPERIKGNIDLFDFELTKDEMESIAKIDKRYRFLRPQDWYGIPVFE